MKRLLVYSHDTWGMGNIRRMLAICHYLNECMPDLSVLLITGSPVIHSLRLPPRLDYIKLPCLTRVEYEDYAVRYLGTEIGEMIRLRADLILSAVRNFKPELLLIDKKPCGVKHELLPALRYAQRNLPASRLALILRDILDSPARTREVWQRKGYYQTIERYYDQILVLGLEEIFDPRREYDFPARVAEKVSFCGYLRHATVSRSRAEIRRELQVGAQAKLVLLTPGGGQDGFELLDTWLAALTFLPDETSVSSLLICGPEMPQQQKDLLRLAAADKRHVALREFTHELPNLMNAADLVISMGGYSTVCEILSLQKRAIVVPRVRPAQEQLIRAERMAARGLFTNIHPDHLTPQGLAAAAVAEFRRAEDGAVPYEMMPMNGLPELARAVAASFSRQDAADLSPLLVQTEPPLS